MAPSTHSAKARRVRGLRASLIALAALGLMIFGGAWLVSFTRPIAVERAARELLRLEIERTTTETVDRLSNSGIAALAARASTRLGGEIEKVRQNLQSELPRKIADLVANMLDADCECRRRLANAMTAAEQQHLQSLLALRQRLTSHLESTYAHVANALLREFRIFTGANALAFLVLLLVILKKANAELQLIAPTVAMVGAVALVGGLYVFRQDWLHTLVFGDYLGLGYAIYLAGTALALLDVLLNRARVSTQIMNALLAIIGAAVMAISC
jgi:hypothetical protein